MDCTVSRLLSPPYARAYVGVAEGQLLPRGIAASHHYVQWVVCVCSWVASAQREASQELICDSALPTVTTSAMRNSKFLSKVDITFTGSNYTHVQPKLPASCRERAR